MTESVISTKPISQKAKPPSVKHAPETEVPKKQPEPQTEEIQKHEPYWFVSDLSFEKKKTRTNRLIVTLKHRDGNKTKDATIYVWHNVTIPTGLIYSLAEVEKILKRHLSDSALNLQKHTVYLSNHAYEKINRLTNDYPTVEFIESYRKMSVIHVTLPLNKELTDKLGSEFQVGGHDGQVARILKLRNRKIIVDKRLEEAMLMRNEVRALQKQVKECAYKTIPENGSVSQSKRTRLLNEILKFFDSHEAMIELSVEEIRKKHPQFSKLVLLDHPEVQTIISLERKIRKRVHHIQKLLHSIDLSHKIELNPETKHYTITLNSSENHSTEFRVNGITVTDRLITYKELFIDSSRGYFDIEKPMFRLDHQNRALELRKTILAAGEDYAQRKSKTLRALEKILTYKPKEGGEISLLKDPYIEKVSRIAVWFQHYMGGKFDAYYLKIILNEILDQSPEFVNGFKILRYKDERALLTAFLKVYKPNRPFFLVNHFLPYDVRNIRDGARGEKAGKFDPMIKNLEPRIFRKKFYQRVFLTGQEPIDTYVLMKNLFPYLSTAEFGLNFKLGPTSTFVSEYLNKPLGLPTRFTEGFIKDMSHAELKENEIKAIAGDQKSEVKMDKYTTSDLGPVAEIFECEPILKILYAAHSLVPHLQISDVAFSLNSVVEMVRVRDWEQRKTQFDFGYSQKKRQDEVEIYQKRFNRYWDRKLKKEGIDSVKPGTHKNVWMTYMPLEHWVRQSFYHVYPQWYQYFEHLPSHPLLKIAALQYPRRFLHKTIRVDYRSFRREHDIVRNAIELRGETMKGMEWTFNLYYKWVNNHNPDLIRDYFGSYNNCKNLFRSFHEALDFVHPKSKAKVRKHIQFPAGARDDIEMKTQIHSFFMDENSDLVALNELPFELEKISGEKAKARLKDFKLSYSKMLVALEQIKDYIRDSNLQGPFSPGDMVYIYNQKTRAHKRRNSFLARYGLSPEEFRELESGTFKEIGEEVKKRYKFAQFKGQYLFVQFRDGVKPDFEGSMLIPMKHFDEITLGPKGKSTKKKVKKKDLDPDGKQLSLLPE